MVALNIVTIVLGLLILITVVVGITTPAKQNPTDHELYGKDSDEYLRDMVGDDYYDKHYK
jgi:hypothetical protein